MCPISKWGMIVSFEVNAVNAELSKRAWARCLPSGAVVVFIIQSQYVNSMLTVCVFVKGSIEVKLGIEMRQAPI